MVHKAAALKQYHFVARALPYLSSGLCLVSLTVSHPSLSASQNALHSRFAREQLSSGAARQSAVNSSSKNAGRGAVVEQVAGGSAADAAGIRVGDTLTMWWSDTSPSGDPPDASGSINSPFDLIEVEAERGRRGAVSVSGLRRGQSFSATLRRTPWGIVVRPYMSQAVLAAYSEKNFRAAAVEAARGRDFTAACWLWLQIGAYVEALRAAQQSGEPHVTSTVLVSAAMDADTRDDLESMVQFSRDALAARLDLTSDSLVLAGLNLNVGYTLWRVGKLAQAHEASTRALSIYRRQVPGTLAEAEALNNLGLIAYQRGQLDRAEELHRHALTIRRKFAAAGPEAELEVARSLKNLGTVAEERGELTAAEQLYQQSLAIRERLAPGGSASAEVAGVLEALGNVAADRGRVFAAEAFYKRALAIQEKLSPAGRESVEVAGILLSLGNIAFDRGDWDAAHDYFEHCRRIRAKHAPGSLLLAAVLNNLGNTARGRDDLVTAEAFHQQALEIRQNQAPDSPDVASSLQNLGNVAYDRNDYEKAGAFYEHALRIKRRLQPRSLSLATTLRSAGSVAFRQKRFARAEQLNTEALAIAETRAPGSAAEAAALHNLARVTWTLGRSAEAGRYFDRAIDAVESQIQELGGGEDVKSEFAVGYAHYYQNYIDFLIEQKQHAKAFHILERSRARSLLAMLAERDLLFSADLPADISRAREMLNTQHERIQKAINAVDAADDPDRRDRLVAQLRELRDRREEIAQRIRLASPRFAALQYPEPLDVRRVQQALDPGTVFLSYAVTEEQTYLFVVQPAAKVVRDAPDLVLLTLPIGRQTLAKEITSFRSQLRQAAEVRARGEAPVEGGTRLYHSLLQPAARFLAKSTRVMIAPSGPLHILPFAALVADDRRPAGGGRYFIEGRPIHVVLSGTLYVELKKSRHPRASAMQVVAFGDPNYAQVEPGARSVEQEEERRAVARACNGFERLKAARREVEGIAGLYGSAATTYLGEFATEGNVKTAIGSARYLHFATHGCLDERFPLNSAIVLSAPPPGLEQSEDGLLQTWEIFERLRTDAELVTLSACDTGLGKDLEGEGLIGLTRAFLYAGAHSVVASLWSVNDVSTAELMIRFYRKLAAGETKDEALRAAQIELMQLEDPGPDKVEGRRSTFANAFHWAGFVLYGEPH